MFDLPPIRFIAIASVVCASREIEPKDIAPVEKRLTISAGRLDLVERHRRAAVLLRPLDAEQAADRQQALRLLVQELGEGAILILRVAAHRMLQQRHRLRRPGMRLAAQPEGIFAADIERVAIDRRIAERVAMAAHRLLGDLGEADALDRGRGAEEEALDECDDRPTASKICAPQ